MLPFFVFYRAVDEVVTMMVPLADMVRPKCLDEVVGQRHILGRGRVLYNLIQKKNVPNMIFFGPSGTGKTTVANIIANSVGKRLYKLNATTASVSDIRAIVGELDSLYNVDGALLYLDEIQNFNKKQQQSLLEFIENGKLTLIASTTENPYFYIYNAILSRSNVFEFKPVDPVEIEGALARAAGILSERMGEIAITFADRVLEFIANVSGGDVRKALNTLEVCVMSADPDKKGNLHVTLSGAEEAAQKKAMRYDRDGDSHYDILSAFQKSIRGSDPDAAIHYLARLLAAGDMISACRRLLVIASEDIGLAYPQAAAITKACVDSAQQLGLPEARIPLAQATLLLATAPKTNTAIAAIDAAMHDLETMDVGGVPSSLQDSHYSGAAKLGHGQGYQYVHNYPNNYVPQQYLPDNIKDRVYYTPGNNKNERAIAAYWDRIKNPGAEEE